MNKIGKALYKSVELLIGNTVINKIPSRRLRIFYYRLMGAKIGKKSVIYRKSDVEFAKGLEIGHNTQIGYYTLLDARGGVKIGNNVNISSYSKLVTGSHDISDGARFQAVFKPITIRDHAWVCTGATVLQGVTIGTGAVVAAGSVVTKDVEPYTVVGGIPAHKISMRNESLSYEVPMAHMLK